MQMKKYWALHNFDEHPKFKISDSWTLLLETWIKIIGRQG